MSRARICTAPCHSALCKTLMRSEPSGKRKANAKIMINAWAAGALLPSVVISRTMLASWFIYPPFLPNGGGTAPVSGDVAAVMFRSKWP